MALVQEARDPVVGRDPLAVGGERGHGAEAIAQAQPERASSASGAHLPSRVKSVQPDHQRVHERDDVDAPVGHLLVLEHQHRRAAGVRAGDDVERIHTDQSVSIIPTMDGKPNARIA